MCSQSINGDYKALKNGSSGGDGGNGGIEMRTGRDNYEVPKCCDNSGVKTPNSPLINRCVPRFRDEDMIDCQFSACECNFRTTDLPAMTNKTETTDVANQNGSNRVQPMEMKKLYDRVTTLEQELYNYKNDVKRLTMIINKLSIANLRERSGTLVWEIDDFEKKVQAMLTNPMTMFYSPDLYTHPYGYRFCGRISIKVKDTIGMHVHMMQSENDFHLDWPFRGCIQIFMINKDSKLTQRDKIMTNEKSTAFQRPNSEISTYSFGFTEYANISSIINDGFLSSDGKLTIKLHISIV